MIFLSTSERRTDSFSNHLESIRQAVTNSPSFNLHDYLIEEGLGDLPLRQETAACFLFQNSVADSVIVAGDFNGWNPKADFMTRIDGTNLFYLVKTFESDARLDYKFVIDGKEWILDPLNPRTIEGGFGSNSELAMPEYAPPDEIRYRENIPHGKIEAFLFPAPERRNAHTIQVYLPPGYDAAFERKYPSLYMHDGSEYLTLGSMANVLDFLIQQEIIQPVVVVFIDPKDRNREYAFYTPYQSLVCDSLVSYIDSYYRIEDDPAKRGIMGPSLGGLVSLDIALHHPDLFGFCGSQSGAFGFQDNRIFQTVREMTPKTLRIYLDWGTYEPRIQFLNQEMRDLLMQQGIAVHAQAFHEGHSWGSWRAHLDDLLKAFIPR